MNLFCEMMIAHILSTSLQKQVDDPFATLLITNLYGIFANGIIDFTVRTKFDHYDTIVHNNILSDLTKRAFVEHFYVSQRTYWTLTAFVRNYIKRKLHY